MKHKKIELTGYYFVHWSSTQDLPLDTDLFLSVKGEKRKERKMLKF